jgi:hypothetical protein
MTLPTPPPRQELREPETDGSEAALLVSRAVRAIVMALFGLSAFLCIVELADPPFAQEPFLTVLLLAVCLYFVIRQIARWNVPIGASGVGAFGSSLLHGGGDGGASGGGDG